VNRRHLLRISAIPTRDDIADRNFTHAQRFVSDVDLAMDLPEGVHLLFYTEADPLLADYNLAVVHLRRDQSEVVYLVPVVPDSTPSVPIPPGESRLPPARTKLPPLVSHQGRRRSGSRDPDPGYGVVPAAGVSCRAVHRSRANQPRGAACVTGNAPALG
jgi:hypothetical protein